MISSPYLLVTYDTQSKFIAGGGKYVDHPQWSQCFNARKRYRSFAASYRANSKPEGSSNASSGSKMESQMHIFAAWARNLAENTHKTINDVIGSRFENKQYTNSLAVFLLSVDSMIFDHKILCLIITFSLTNAAMAKSCLHFGFMSKVARHYMWKYIMIKKNIDQHNDHSPKWEIDILCLWIMLFLCSQQLLYAMSLTAIDTSLLTLVLCPCVLANEKAWKNIS